MRLTLAFSSALAVFAAMLLCSTAARADTAVRFMALGRQVAPPRGYVEFCTRQPQECPEFQNADKQAANVDTRSEYWRMLFSSVEPGSIKSNRLVQGVDARAPTSPSDGSAQAASVLVALSAKTLRDLNLVNRSVNAAIAPRTDMQVYGVQDYWAEPLSNGQRYGDCEDYVLQKRRNLRELGYPASALSIAIVQTPWGEDHAVLLVDTDQGEFVLDSLSPWISSWRNVSYRWISRQSPMDPSIWVSGPA